MMTHWLEAAQQIPAPTAQATANMIEAFKLIANGAVGVALIVVFWMFLKSARDFAGDRQRLEDSKDRQAREFLDTLDRLRTSFEEMHKSDQSAIYAVIDDQMALTREAIGAIKAVETTVQQLTVAVKALEGIVHEGKSRPGA